MVEDVRVVSVQTDWSCALDSREGGGADEVSSRSKKGEIYDRVLNRREEEAEEVGAT